MMSLKRISDFLNKRLPNLGAKSGVFQNEVVKNAVREVMKEAFFENAEEIQVRVYGSSVYIHCTHTPLLNDIFIRREQFIQKTNKKLGKGVVKSFYCVSA